MKFRCTCDAIICDQTDSVPHKAWLLPDESSDEFYSGASELIAGYMQAVLAGREIQWLNDNVSEEYSKLGLDRESIVHDLLVRFHIRLNRVVYLCYKCGRLFVSDPHSKNLLAYSPEDSPVLTDALRRTSANTHI